MMGGRRMPRCLFNPLILLFLLLLLLFHSPEVAGQIGQIRLSGGTGPYEGNVEVEVDGVWGFVCDDDFGFKVADLVCRDLGYSYAERFTRNNHFGDKSPGWRRREVKFWLERAECTFTNISLRDCTFPGGLGYHDCGPTEVAGVVCATGEARCSPDEFACSTVAANVSCIPRDFVCDVDSDCSDDSDEDPDMCEDVGVVRLRSHTPINLPGAALGTVFVKHQQQWGTVCDDDFDLIDAKVICRSLGYEGGWLSKFTHAYLGQGSGPIFLTRLRCSGEEEWLGQCNGTGWEVDDCFHGEDAGVFCYDGGLEVRLMGGESSNTGRVEVQVEGQWGALCHNGFDDFDAKVVCRMLGYEGEAAAHKDSHFGSDTGPVWDLFLDCRGTEDHLQGCGIKVSNDTCSQDTTAGVTCSNSVGRLDEELQSVLPSECGVPLDPTHQFLGPLARLRGGSRVSIFDVPWFASLRIKALGRDNLVCGATILSEDYLLTAAQCFDAFGKNVYVRVGDYNINYAEADQEDFFIDKVWVHDGYDSATLDNNIALVKIERKYGRGISLGPRVKAACLPRVGDSYDDLSSCSVAGRGATDTDTGLASLEPRRAAVDIVSDKNCEVVAGSKYTSSMVCAEGTKYNIEPCNGDQGGPLTCLVGGSHKLYGIISSVRSCGALFGGPEAYTRVTKFLRWIRDIIVNNKRLV